MKNKPRYKVRKNSNSQLWSVYLWNTVARRYEILEVVESFEQAVKIVSKPVRKVGWVSYYPED